MDTLYNLLHQRDVKVVRVIIVSFRERQTDSKLEGETDRQQTRGRDREGQRQFKIFQYQIVRVIIESFRERQTQGGTD